MKVVKEFKIFDDIFQGKMFDDGAITITNIDPDNYQSNYIVIDALQMKELFVEYQKILASQL